MAEQGGEPYVVQELDVYVCNDLSAQLVLLQQPLRPTWRPYESTQGASARYKPGADRLELHLPAAPPPPTKPNLDEDSVHVRALADAAAAPGGRPGLTLRSTAVAGGATSLALGLLRDGALVLAPISAAYQLRPHLAHLEQQQQAGGGLARAASLGGDAETDEEMAEEAAGASSDPKAPAALTALEVTVKRRETERQAAARQRSWAYLAAQEEAEPWLDLAVHGPQSAHAAALMAALTRRVAAPVGAPLGRAEYLAALVPPPPPGDAGGAAGPWGGQLPPGAQPQQPQQGQPAGDGAAATAAAAAAASAAAGGARGVAPGAAGAAGAAAAAAAAAAGGGGGAGRAGAVAPPGALDSPASLTPALAAALAPALAALFRSAAVVGLGDVRAWLAGWDGGGGGGGGGPAPAPPAAPSAAAAAVAEVRRCALAGDELLHAALVGGAGGSESPYLCIRGSYLCRAGGPPGCEALRAVVVRLLQDRGSLKKQEVFATAAAAGVAAKEAQYQRVMKELCRNHGNNWVLKTSMRE